MAGSFDGVPHVGGGVVMGVAAGGRQVGRRFRVVGVGPGALSRLLPLCGVLRLRLRKLDTQGVGACLELLAVLDLHLQCMAPMSACAARGHVGRNSPLTDALHVRRCTAQKAAQSNLITCP